MRRSLSALLAVAVLSASVVLTGCASKSRAGSATKPEQQSVPAAQPTVPVELPGNAADLASALAEKAPVKYRIVTVSDTQGKDTSGYFDQALEQSGALASDTLLLMVFLKANYDIRFAMGADFAAKQVMVEDVLGLVRSEYLGEARKGDPAAGLAKLVRAVNQRVTR